MSKIIYIIPGYTHTINRECYVSLIDFYREKGFDVVPVSIKRKYKTMSDYIDQFFSQLRKHKDDDEIYLLGYSFGAFIAFVVASKIPNSISLLCSLSPYFKEDLERIEDSWRIYVGKRRIGDFGRFCFCELTKTITSKTFLFYGSKEVTLLIDRVKLANEVIEKTSLIEVPGVGHDLSDDRYLEAVKNVVL